MGRLMEPRQGDYVRLYGTAATHDKQVEAGLEAVGLWARVLARSATQSRTPDVVPLSVIAEIGGRHARKLTERLCDVGLWDRCEGEQAVRIHDYDGHQVSRDRREEKRQAEAERQQQWRDRKRERNALHNSHVTPPETRTSRSIEVERELEKELTHPPSGGRVNGAREPGSHGPFGPAPPGPMDSPYAAAALQGWQAAGMLPGNVVDVVEAAQQCERDRADPVDILAGIERMCARNGAPRALRIDVNHVIAERRPPERKQPPENPIDARIRASQDALRARSARPIVVDA